MTQGTREARSVGQIDLHFRPVTVVCICEAPGWSSLKSQYTRRNRRSLAGPSFFRIFGQLIITLIVCRLIVVTKQVLESGHALRKISIRLHCAKAPRSAR